MRGDPRISESTRERIARVAESMGYSVHPMIAAWVSARRSGRKVEAKLPLAYVVCDSLEEEDEASRSLQAAYFRGAENQAASNGFVLTRFKLSEYRRNARRLEEVLRARGIRGVLFGPSVQEVRLSGWDWSQLSCIAIGRSMEEPVMHRVLGCEFLREDAFDSGARDDLAQRIGRNAIDWLVLLMNRNQLGLPEERHTLLVELPAESLLAV